jgi:hypothetical protein
MAKSFFERRKIFKTANYLELTPVLIFDSEESEEGLITILIPRFKGKFMNKYIVREKARYIYLKLDELGSATWKAVDGKKNVGQICEELKVTLGDKLTHAEERITKFLSILYNNRHITFKEIE